MTVEQMMKMADRMSNFADGHDEYDPIHMSFKERSWTLRMGAEICERLDKLIEQGESDDG